MGSDFMARRIAHPPAAAILPTSDASGAVALQIADRRKKLVEHEATVPHRPRGIRVAAVGLAAAYEIANGHTPDIRADRQVRYRIEQFSGGEPMPLEDLTAIGEESEFGRDVAVACMTAVLAAWGRTVSVTTAASECPREALAEVIDAERLLDTDAVLALAGEVNAAMLKRLESDIAREEEKLEKLRASLRAALQSPDLDKRVKHLSQGVQLRGRTAAQIENQARRRKAAR